MRQVLVIEDDKDIAELVSIHHQDLVCQIKHCSNGKEGLSMAMAETFHLIILDIMLPGMDGLEICKELRAREICTPVLMLTAKSEEIDKVLGLEMGADDYLTKPFSVREFVARVKAIFRRQSIHERSSDQSTDTVIRVENLVIEIAKRKVTLNGNRIELTPKEFDILMLLASHPGIRRPPPLMILSIPRK